MKSLLKHYSHIRMQAKRLAVENLVAKPKPQNTQSKLELDQSERNFEGMVQDSVQVSFAH